MENFEEKKERISVEKQKESLIYFKEFKNRILDKAKKKIVNWQKWFYIEKLESFRDKLIKHGYNDEERSSVLSYHPIWNSDPTEDIYEIDFPGVLSVSSFLSSLENELDNMPDIENN